MEVLEIFEKKTEDFIFGFEISQKDAHTVGNVFRTQVMGDSYLLDVDDSERRVGTLFSNVEREINPLCSESSRMREEALSIYLCKQNSLTLMWTSRNRFLLTAPCLTAFLFNVPEKNHDNRVDSRPQSPSILEYVPKYKCTKTIGTY